MNAQPIQEIPLKKNFRGQVQTFLQNSLKNLQRNQPLLKSLILTLIAAVFFLGVYYADIWQSQLVFRQRWFGLACIGVYTLVSYLLAIFSSWDRPRILSAWIQSNLLTLISFAYFLRLSNRELEVWNFSFNTGLIFVALIGLIFLVNYNLFGKNQRQLWLLLPQVVLFALQGFSFLSLTGTYITDSTSFSSDWLNLLFGLHPFLWLTTSGLAIAAISVLSLDLIKKDQLLRFLALFSFLMVQGVLVIYLVNFTDLGLSLTYWNLALMTLIFWDYLDTPLRIVAHKLEDPKYNSRLAVSTVYHALLLLLVVFAPQIQLLVS